MYKSISFKSTCILILIVFTSSCALTSFQTPRRINTTQVIPLPVNEQRQPIIVLARPFNFSQALISYKVSDNGNTVGVIANNSYLNWVTKAGKITLTLEPNVATQCYTHDDDCLNKNVDLINIKTSQPITKFTFNAIAGNTYYLTLNPRWCFFTNTPGKVDVVLTDSIDVTELKPPVINIR